MSFEIEFERAGVIKTIADTIKDLNQVVVFNISEQYGMYMQAMDSAAVSLCELKMPLASFKRFQTLDASEKYSVGIHIGALTMVMKCFNSDKKIIMKMDSTDKVILTDGEQFTFHLSLVDVNADTLELPYTVYTTCIKMKSDFVRKLMHDMGEFGSRCSFSSKQQALTIEFSGGMYGNACVEVKDVCVGEDLSHPLVMSLRHMKIFSKASALGDDVVIEAVAGLPLKITYGFGGDCLLTFFLAPQIHD